MPTFSMLIPIFFMALLALNGCGSETKSTQTVSPTNDGESPPAHIPAPRLARTLAAQPPEVQARYPHRHVRQTLEFFGITPGMQVVEALPEGGWYTKILLPYLGKDGHLTGADYALDMYPKFGFYDDEYLAAKASWARDWIATAETWRDDDSASVSAFAFGSMPDALTGKADAVLFIRALHNLNNYEEDGGYLTSALADAYRALRSGGIVGIVQHRSADDMPDTWADGSNGYLKESLVVTQMQAAGFELLGRSDVNANPKDQPGEDDFVWRLPPTLDGSDENDERRAEMEAIGESDRMTLKFRKP